MPYWPAQAFRQATESSDRRRNARSDAATFALVSVDIAWPLASGLFISIDGKSPKPRTPPRTRIGLGVRRPLNPLKPLAPCTSPPPTPPPRERSRIPRSRLLVRRFAWPLGALSHGGRVSELAALSGPSLPRSRLSLSRERPLSHRLALATWAPLHRVLHCELAPVKEPAPDDGEELAE